LREGAAGAQHASENAELAGHGIEFTASARAG
jgi:hypothetical protein